jgi:hypothetical protein
MKNRKGSEFHLVKVVAVRQEFFLTSLRVLDVPITATVNGPEWS